MRLLLAAGADPSLTTKSNATALTAAVGDQSNAPGKATVTEDQALEADGLLLELGDGPRKQSRANGENALFGTIVRGWNKASSTDDRQRERT